MAFETALSIKVDTKQAQTELRKTDTALKKLGRAANDNARKVTQSTDKMKRGFVGLKTVIASLGIGLLAKNFISVSSSFEQLRIQLKTVTGSVEDAERAFKRIKALAVATPFSVQNLTKSFIRLKAIGIEPTNELLVAFGDVAAGLGRDITDFTRAATGAAFGETEALKSFGIAAKVEGDKIRLIFKGVTTEVDRDVNSIINALVKIGQVGFAGAAEDQVNSFKGAVSNLGDAWEAFLDKLNTSQGVTNTLAAGIRKLGDGIAWLTDPGLRLAEQNATFLKNAFIALIKVLGTAAVLNAGVAFIKFARALTFARIATIAFTVAQNVSKLGLLVTAVVLASITGAYDKLKEALIIVAKKASDLLGPAFEELLKLMEGMGLNLDLLEKEMNQFSEKTDVATHSVTKLSQAMKDTAKDLKKDMRTGLEIYNDRMAELNKLHKAGAILQETFRRATNDAKDTLIDTDPVLNKVTGGIDEFSDALVEGELNMKKFGQIVLSVLNDIAKDIISSGIKGLLRDLIPGGGGGGGLGSIFGSLFGGGGGGASVMPTNFMTGSFAMAEGGVVTRPTRALIGEAGPEAVIPLGKGGGMGGTVINIDARGSNGDAAVEAAVERGIRQASPQLINASVNKVKEERQRDPSFFGSGSLA